jgi:hypothetical protein
MLHTRLVDPDLAEALWADLRSLFCDEEDENPLPEFHVCELPANAAAAIWRRLLDGARLASPDAVVFVKAEQRDVPVRDVRGLPARAQAGEIDMHVVLGDVLADGRRLPDLGVSIYPDEIVIDYRVNVWDRDSAAALIHLLGELQSLAAGSTVLAADAGGVAHDADTQARVARAIQRTHR